ncbi:MAG: hypothetical protein GVY04_17340 [Cyanobacteria bacterium]|nr:hypothetical protein [Cyanobacteria bacterium GSL.Bin1]
MTIQTQTLGYPRIGKKRELKKALEAYWKGESNAETLLKAAREVETNNWKAQLNAGIDRIGVGNATLDEAADLETAGAKMIQMDEPALREGLPLKPERWNSYLS